MKKTGFTLAEVLITLTIIGIIAVLTIPNLMQSYKKHQVEVKLKDTYAILSNALKMSENENGSTSEWKIYWSTSKIADIAENKLIPYLKVTKNCKDTKNLCFKSITDMDGNIFDISYSFILANGTSLGIVVQSEQFILLFADIDGPERGKSELGRDVFAFSIINNNYSPQVSFSPGAFYSPSKNNFYITQNINALLDTVAGACSPGHNSNNFRSGYQCSAVIAKNNWKIPDNYPVKKF